MRCHRSNQQSLLGAFLSACFPQLRTVRRQGVALACLLALAPMTQAAELQLFTEEYPPINFSRDGKPTGLATEVVEEILRRTHTVATIAVVPWARGYKMAQVEPNTGLFATMRTPEREPLFKWVGPITTTVTSFYARHGSRLHVTSLEEAKRLKRIVVPREWFSHQVLRKLGFPNLEPVVTPDQMVKMTLNARADLLVADNQTLPAQVASVGAKMGDLDLVYTFMKTNSYIVFSRDTPDETIQTWQEALDSMKRDGSFARIYRHWLPGTHPPGVVAEPDLVPGQ